MRPISSGAPFHRRARGELVRSFGELLRQEKETLGPLVSLEAGKILQEGWARSRR
jgi:acyl-CoA reductase-like NAD-dependent aldehyde dehydrogenase